MGRLSIAAEYQQGNNSNKTWQTHYTHDRWGNRFQSGSGNSGPSYISVVSSEIDAVTNRFIASGSTPTTYDYAGNITTDTKFRTRKYEYDANGRQTAVKLTDNTLVQSSVYDCGGQRVQTTANGVTPTMVYDIFGQQVADYSGASLQRENIYRGGQLLSVIETPTGTAPSALSAVRSGTISSPTITLSWTGAATNYRIERKGAEGSYVSAGASTSAGFTDNEVTAGSAYLYKVCASDGQNNCVSAYSNVALGTAVGFTDDPLTVGVTLVKLQHMTELRQTVNAVRSLAGLSAASWTNTTLTAGVSLIKADDVRDLREELHDALIDLAIQTTTYTDSTLATGENGTLIKKAHFAELRDRATSGAGTSGSGGSSGGLRYVMQDIQGSTRAVMSGASIVARHDYLPFGEEIGAGTGLRVSGQGYGASDTNRMKYGLTERDDTTGLDHTWWRKYENSAGRWTTPDPLGGGIGDPQSFNRYSYVSNDPLNLVDPSGLIEQPGCGRYVLDPATNAWEWIPCSGTTVDFPIPPDDTPISWSALPGASGPGNSIPMRMPTSQIGERSHHPGSQNPQQQRQSGPTFEALFEKVKGDCLARKKAQADSARKRYTDKFGQRLMISMGVGTVTGAIRGARAGAAGGALFAGVGAVPGAIYGGVVGGIFGAAAGVFSGVAKEPLQRAWYDYSTHNPALNTAHLDCDAEARAAVFDSRNGGRRR